MRNFVTRACAGVLHGRGNGKWRAAGFDVGEFEGRVLARPATIPRARATETEQKAISYQFLTNRRTANAAHPRGFFYNRIEIESPGLLLPGLPIKDIKQGVSQIRNPVIARVFRELELVEEWGSGISGIFRIAKEENFPEPKIEELAGRVRFTVPHAEILPLTRG